MGQKNKNIGVAMSDSKDTNDAKVKELREIMANFVEQNPVALPLKQEQLPEKKPDTDFTVVETSRTLTYSQKGWTLHGELVRNS